MRFLVILVLLSPSLVISAPLQEGFEGIVFPPTGWITHNYVAEPADTVSRSTTQYHSGSASARFSSFSTFDANEWLITPILLPTSTDTFIFWHRSHTSGSESFEVLLSLNAGTDSSDFTIQAWDTTVSGAAWMEKKIPLATYDGDTIRIALHYYSNWEYYLWIDDVSGPEVYSPPPPNLVGDCETELGDTTDWDNGDSLTNMLDPDGDGIWEVTLVAVADFPLTEVAGHQVVGTAGQWTPQFPGQNVPVGFHTDDTVTFYFDRNVHTDGFVPESCIVYNSWMADSWPGPYYVVGSCQTEFGASADWDAADTTMTLNDLGVLGDPVAGDGIYTFQGICSYMGNYDVKVLCNYGAPNPWRPQYAQEGFVWDWGTNIGFSISGDSQVVRFEVDIMNGRVRIKELGPSGTIFAEDFELDWGPWGDNPPDYWEIIDLGDESPPEWNGNDWHRYWNSIRSSHVARVYYSPIEQQNELLITPLFDLSAYSSLELQFWHEYNDYSGDTDSAFVYRVIPGDTMFLGIYAGADSGGVENLVFAGGYDSLQIIFKYVGNNDWWWMIDDVVLMEWKPGAGDLAINEFTSRGSESIELLNKRDFQINLTGWILTNGVTADTLSGTISPLGYFVHSNTNLSLNDDGDQIVLLTPDLDTTDQVAYGYLGGSPVPPLSFSSARAPDGQDTNNDAHDFTLDGTPTFGLINDAMEADLGSSLVINEVDLIPEPSSSDGIEVYNPTPDSINILGWLISNGDTLEILLIDHWIASGEVFAFFKDSTGSFTTDFTDLDVAYLFDPDTSRVDQTGFYGESEDGSFQRYPDGAGPNSGYDYWSTHGDSTWFDRTPTLGSLNLPFNLVYQTGFENGDDKGYILNLGTGSNPHDFVVSDTFTYTPGAVTVYPASGDSFLVCTNDPNGYDNDEFSWWFNLPASDMDLSSYAMAYLKAKIWYMTETGWDLCLILGNDKSRDSTTYYVLDTNGDGMGDLNDAFSGDCGGWIPVTADLTPLCGKDGVEVHDDVEIAFLLWADGSNSGPDGYGFGFGIDDIRVEAGGLYLAPPTGVVAISHMDAQVSLDWDAPTKDEGRTYRLLGISLKKNDAGENNVKKVGVGRSDCKSGEHNLFTHLLTVDPSAPVKQSVSYYEIFRRAEGEDVFSFIDTTSTDHYDDNDVTNGNFYTYYISAVFDIDPPNRSFSDWMTAKPGTPIGEILFVSDQSDGYNDPEYWDTLYARLLGFTDYDIWNYPEYREPALQFLNGYNTVIWYTGTSNGYSAVNPTEGNLSLTTKDRLLLTYWLDYGTYPEPHNLCLSGMWIAWNTIADTDSQIQLPDLLFDYYFYLNYPPENFTDWIDVDNAWSLPGSGMGFVGVDTFGVNWRSSENYPDQLEPIASYSRSVFEWLDPTNTSHYQAGIQYDGGHFKTVFLSCPFEGMAEPETVMTRMLDWFASITADAAVDTIIAPRDTVWVDSTYYPTAVVRNLGEGLVNFEVECLIDTGSVIWADTIFVDNLRPDSSRQLVFKEWVVGLPLPMVYTISVIAKLDGDIQPINDTLTCQVTSVGVGLFEFPQMIPRKFNLAQNKPNPAKAPTIIEYQLPKETWVNLQIYDISGRRVRTLVNQTEAPGYYRILWDGRDGVGTPLPAGIYFYKFEAEDYRMVRKLVLMR